ncbi:MAG: DUF3160 domain-containing protein [Methanofollis sp.]|uniref:DUF3160 domain-containing protein n=1 Tax=Methanofollis sp. TaxID=2052835 RepID=UPI0026293EDD|nr:DUF3160 domain-containing protein [Methanofollis sp.]MDD4255578.1 DUF3160 domain-containing protein [Methanofollis sp.]
MDRTALLALLLCAAALLAGCVTAPEAPQPEKNFSAYPTPAPLAVNLSAPQYPLPLETANVTNWQEVDAALSLDPGAETLLSAHGFVVVENPLGPGGADMVRPYAALKEEGVPVFVSTDSLLHIYHIQFDETMRAVEEGTLYDDLYALDSALLNRSMEAYGRSGGEAKEAARRNAVYFGVAQSLLAPDARQVGAGTGFEPADVKRYRAAVPEEIRPDVEAELLLIRGRAGTDASPLFRYEEDYSQYLPRGHYTRSERLKNYFLAMMWHGRMAFLLNGTLVTPEDARVQTIGAAQVAAALADDPALMERWDRIYTATSFYAGYSDDLGPRDYLAAMDALFGGPKTDLSADEVAALQRELGTYRAPAIYGGTADCYAFTPEEARTCLNATQGFRFMGQRFLLDSYIFSELVYPYTGDFTGTGTPFTLRSGGRSIPTALDVMSLLGSERADAILDENGDSRYEHYDAIAGRLAGELPQNESAWNRNLAIGWLHTLQPLLAGFGEGYPTFMQTTAWQEKELTTSLASWTELRRDTILYAKQSYTMGKGMAYRPPEQEVAGYVEPVPELYHRLLALTAMTREGLGDLGALDETSGSRLRSLEAVLARLEAISVKELEGEALTPDDEAFIRGVASSLDQLVVGVDEDGMTTAVVADVHTDPYDSLVLEEGVGYVNLVVVACPGPDGRPFLAAGPVFSYYEFTVPLSGRLTDEAWQEVLATDPPARPGWTVGYAAVRR